MRRGGRIKKIAAILTCAGMAFAAVGCGAGSDEQGNGAETVQTAESEPAETAEKET